MEGGPSTSGASEKANGPIITIEVLSAKSDPAKAGKIGAAWTLAATSAQENRTQTIDVSASMMKEHDGECSSDMNT